MLERSKEVLERWKAKGLNSLGQFIPSSKPSALALRHTPQPSMFELVREAVRSQRLADEANEAGFDTFEEANDFDIEGDPFPRSKYERPFEEMAPGELTKRRRKAERDLAELKAAEAAKRGQEGRAREAEPKGGAKREGTEQRPEAAKSGVDYGLDPE